MRKRAGRIFKTQPVLAVAGTASELSELIRASVLKVDTVRTIALAWVDDILEEGPETIAALEVLLGELLDERRGGRNRGLLGLGIAVLIAISLIIGWTRLRGPRSATQ